MAIDVLAIGAHPDDIEFSCCGTIAKLVKQKKNVGILDLTQGELGTRGNKNIRNSEATNAGKILGVAFRENLKLADGSFEVNQKNILKVISVIRKYRPKILLIPPYHERHPPHEHAHQLAKESWFYSGLKNIITKENGKTQEPFRPDTYFQFMLRYEFQPTFIVDISDVYEIRVKAIEAFESQVHSKTYKSNEPQTLLSKPTFKELLEIRAKFYGSQIGVKYGEPFYYHQPLGVDDLFSLKLFVG